MCIPSSPIGHPYPPHGRSKTVGTRVYPPLSGSGWILCVTNLPTWRPSHLGGPGKTGGTPVYPLLCVRGPILCISGFAKTRSKHATMRQNWHDSGSTSRQCAASSCSVTKARYGQ